jgi:Flp pilus assembly protein TadG/cellulose biosynthesis protein BcsQ
VKLVSRGRNKESERGQIVVLLAVSLTLMLLFLAFAIDVGFAFATKAKLSKAVDAACLTALRNLAQGQAKAGALATNSFNGNYEVSALDANPPTINVSFSTDAYGNTLVNVTATATIRTFFMRLLPKFQTFSVSDSAQATRGNVAAALALPDHTTIATEWCWPRGNFSLYLGEQPARNLSAIGTLPPRAITKSVLKNLLVTNSNNLMLLHGPQTAAEFKYWNPAQAEAFVASLLQIADFAVMDLPPHPSAVSRVAVHNSSIVVVVLERNPESVVLANETLSMVRLWAAGGAAITAVVVSKGRSATAMALDDIRSQLRCGIVGVVPPSTEPVPGCSRQLPITISRQGTLPADTSTDIAKRLASKQLELLPY